MDRDIEANLGVIREAVLATKTKVPTMPRSAVHSDKDRAEWQKQVDSHQQKQEELGEAAIQSGFLLGAMFLSDVRRIADALEIIAKQTSDDNLFRGK